MDKDILQLVQEVDELVGDCRKVLDKSTSLEYANVLTGRDASMIQIKLEIASYRLADLTGKLV